MLYEVPLLQLIVVIVLFDKGLTLLKYKSSDCITFCIIDVPIFCMEIRECAWKKYLLFIQFILKYTNIYILLEKTN